MNLESTPEVLNEFAKNINELEVINSDSVKQAFKNVQAVVGVKGKQLFMPVRLKLTGMMHGPEMVNIISVLGKEETIARLTK